MFLRCLRHGPSLVSSSSSPVFRSWFPEHTLRTRLASSFGPEPVLLLHLLALACLRLLSSVTVHVAVSLTLSTVSGDCHRTCRVLSCDLHGMVVCAWLCLVADLI